MIENTRGFALITTLFMLTILMSLMGAFFVTSKVELSMTKMSRDATTGFYAAEAGLNLRAETIREIFVGYNRPDGVSPDSVDACVDGNDGEDDFACATFEFGKRDAVTYVEEEPGNPIILTIPPGELYQNLNAQEYRYTVNSIARDEEQNAEAILQLRFKSRLVPLFQFVAFYDKDLEILPGPVMNLSGPIHTNGDLYLNAGNALNVAGQVSTAGELWRGRKNDNSCKSKPVTVLDPLTPLAIHPTCATRTLVTAEYLEPWNDMVQIEVEDITVPAPEALDPESPNIYWLRADLRLVLNLDAGNNPDLTNSATGVEVRAEDDSLETSLITKLDGCAGSIDESSAGANDGRPIGYTYDFHSNREAKRIRMLEVDMTALLDCIHTEELFGIGNDLDDDSEGGIVFHFTVKGPDSTIAANDYGVRIRKADELQATSGLGAPLVKGMTVVSDQAAYVVGNYNATNKIPAAIMADTFNPLSNKWQEYLDNGTETAESEGTLNGRVATDTVFNGAVLAGTDVTGGTEGSGGQDSGAYNGGLENYPRFHEKWSSRTFSYRGSFVSLNTPRRQNGAWHYGGSGQPNPANAYTAPNRDWDYDTDFNDASNLPPLTPRFVYLRQELFVREYEQQ